MKYKKIIFICYIVVILFSISFVSANDFNETITIETEQLEDIISTEPLTNETVLNSEGTFSELKDEIYNSDSELKLTKNYTYTDEDAGLNNGIPIKKRITIDGNGFTINGNGKSRVFNITDEVVILKNIHFLNCFAESGGAIIVNNVDYSKITNCTFTNNNVKYSGGSIYINTSTLKIEYTSFIDNYAKSTGGAIYATQSKLVLNYCNFTNNKAKYYGGAIELFSDLSGTGGRIENCKFRNNTIIAQKDPYWYEQYHCPLIKCYIDNSDSKEVIGGYSTPLNGGSNYEGEIYIYRIYTEYYRGESINLTTTISMDEYYYFESYPETVFSFLLEGKEYIFTKSEINHTGHRYLITINATITPKNGGDFYNDYFSIKEKTKMEVIVHEKIVDITIFKPKFYNGKNYYLGVEKLNSDNSWTQNSLKLTQDNTLSYYLGYLNSGLHQFRVHYSNFLEDHYYYFNITQTEYSTILTESISGQTGSNALLIAKIEDYGQGGTVEVIIDGKKYTSPVEYGRSEVLIKLPNKAGTFNYKVTFTSNSEYIISSSANFKITTKWGTKITIKSITGYQGKKVKLKAIIKDSNGKKIKKGTLRFEIITEKQITKKYVTVHCDQYVAKIKNGVATIKIKYPKAKVFKTVQKTKKNILTKITYYKSTYIGNVEFIGKGDYLPASSSFKITSKKKPVVKKYRIIKSISKKKTTTKPKTSPIYGSPDVFLRQDFYPFWFNYNGHTLGNIPVTYKIYTGLDYKEYKSQTTSLGYVDIAHIPKGTHKIYIEGKYLLDTKNYHATFIVHRS